MPENKPPAGCEPTGRGQRDDGAEPSFAHYSMGTLVSASCTAFPYLAEPSFAHYSMGTPLTPSPEMNISCVKVKLTPAAGAMKALCVVRIGPLTVHGVKVIAKPGKDLFAVLPQRPMDGGWAPVITSDDPDFRDKLNSVCVVAYTECQLQGGCYGE